MIIDWKKIANEILDDLKNQISNLPDSSKPTLAVILVGNNPASIAYVNMKKRRCEQIGMNFILQNLDKNISQIELEKIVENFGNNPDISGIIVQAPLPAHIDNEKIIEKIPQNKDVDGFSRAQIGNVFLNKKWLWSCTPKGIMTLLDKYNISLEGKKVAILGRSNIVGKPMALMMINSGATVTVCNSKTPNLSEITKNSEIIIVAIGKPKFLTREMISPGSVIIDVGSNLLENGTFCWDVDFENVVDFVDFITPSPGWVGPMTVATLLENTFLAFIDQNNAK